MTSKAVDDIDGLWFFLLTTSCVVTKTISVALLLYPGLGLALSESEQWRSYRWPFNVFALFIGFEECMIKVSKTSSVLFAKADHVDL